ncbi:uncharacterized protein L3040_002981 [Drepanopeziza brunnea f. sp. 'multigermtubi']|uniref:Uncharacterized protein n=1 Tax=Marssonina brunnea f. sp. multigermtubi (strain MB_m1) TaxID=1072389 RepID=K1XL66_MARBU|nr:uncharacterized protein MBM_08622 [Drepanopeziza brunnea f. sp. 'multigermtubi' MB_m1]EKD13179.1 hypothetical protein MBM_08622 [Drepanopeziza brunnea f. sp. 'multigermtubi' MB_m1]KAJ5047139.1 hypothetical protein L3040_002981 [Drepanopeziza brunnea f. sp. 'multigermtubi']
MAGPRPQRGLVHQYVPSELTAFEHKPYFPPSAPQNIILFIGWGTSSLLKDAYELSECVTYFGGIKTGKIVLMGHATGCQDIMEYLTGTFNRSRPKIDGGTLQGTRSDRQALLCDLEPEYYESSCPMAQGLIDQREGREMVLTWKMKGILSFANRATTENFIFVDSESFRENSQRRVYSFRVPGPKLAPGLHSAGFRARGA